MFILVFVIVLIIYLVIYVLTYFLCQSHIKNVEHDIVNIFHQKVSKIPALIEVMRPHVFEERAFDLITSLHSETMIRDYNGIYNLLEHNARIHDQFLFLLKLSVHIPHLQKDPYFLYIRDFIISYDRDIQAHFSTFNRVVGVWNRFILLKNMTIIGLILPGRVMMRI